MNHYLKNALVDKSNIPELVGESLDWETPINEEQAAVVSQLLDRWGLCEETARPLAKFSLLSGAKEHSAALCKKHDILATLKDNDELSEQFFMGFSPQRMIFVHTNTSATQPKTLSKK
ncbi:MAG: hypothetical protein LBJ12_09630 [Oscillospiraceae bacterium]|jgi:hypothetical protein|nr:hypothetical protein [Oscillospiraceae bacterium]